MAVKKVIIPKESLPALNENGEYIVRYRIISDDKNRFSQWSNQYIILGSLDTPNPDENISVVVADTFVSSSWTDESFRQYDVFVAWGTETGSVGSYTYFTSVSGQFIVIPIPTSPTYASVKIRIQLVSPLRQINNNILIAESSIKTL